MPEKFSGRAGLVLLLALMLVPSMSKAEPTHCFSLAYMSRNIAMDIARDIAMGFPVETIRGCNPQICTSEETIADYEEHFDSLKAAVKEEWDRLPDSPDRADLAAQRVLEFCLQDYGKNRKKYLHKTQGEHFSNPAIVRQRVCGAQAKIAAQLYKDVKEAGSADEIFTRAPPENEGIDRELLRPFVEGILADENPDRWLTDWYHKCLGVET